jgi:mRNA-degrading endonuclease toxin of MazEF toxin-antitoxin module
MEQSEVWWADLDEPAGSEAGYRRPVLVIQCKLVFAGIDTILGR